MAVRSEAAPVGFSPVPGKIRVTIGDEETALDSVSLRHESKFKMLENRNFVAFSIFHPPGFSAFLQISDRGERFVSSWREWIRFIFEKPAGFVTPF